MRGVGMLTVIIMTDLRPGALTAGIEAACADQSTTAIPQEYRIENCSVRVRNFIQSTVFEYAKWTGLR